jgi:hypothetical protein
MRTSSHHFSPKFSIAQKLRSSNNTNNTRNSVAMSNPHIPQEVQTYPSPMFFQSSANINRPRFNRFGISSPHPKEKESVCQDVMIVDTCMLRSRAHACLSSAEPQVRGKKIKKRKANGSRQQKSVLTLSLFSRCHSRRESLHRHTFPARQNGLAPK